MSSATFTELWQKRRDQDRAGRPEQRPLQDALQLAEVARPGVGAELFHRLGGDLSQRPL
jgi:hypothetical protein